MSVSSNTKLVTFIIGGKQEQIVITRTGVTAESLLRVLQLLRDKSPDFEVGEGARILITLISETLRSSIKNVGLTKITVSFKWLRELSYKAQMLAVQKNQKSGWFVVAFIGLITPKEVPEEVVQ